MKKAVLYNRGPARGFLGFRVILYPGENLLEPEVVQRLRQNCPNFQDAIRGPDEDGLAGGPLVKILPKPAPDGRIRVFSYHQDPTGLMFNAPEVKLPAHDSVEVTEEQFERLKQDKRFMALWKEGQIEFLGWQGGE